MLHDIKMDSLQTVSLDGAALEPLYHAPKTSSNLVAKDELKIYNGNCHCGAVTYSVRSELLTQTGPPVCECDCSICSRVSVIFSLCARGLTPQIIGPTPLKIMQLQNGYLWIYPRIADVEVHNEEEAPFTDYIFGQAAIHRFCSICGSSMFNYLQDPKIDIRPVNVRTLNGLGAKRLNVVRNYKPPIVLFKD